MQDQTAHERLPAFAGAHEPKPLPFDPSKLPGLSERLVRSHWENTYCGAVKDGDFAMLENELQPVLKALRAAGIDIVAIHQHMVGEQPRVLFLHYWGVGPAESLARGLRSALDRTATHLAKG